MSDEHKAKGNKEFTSGNFQEAITHYSAGIEVDPTNHVLFSNRSACQASLGNWEDALQDAKKTVDLKPDWAKGYSRLGGAQFGLKHFDEAIEAYKKGLELDPNNGPCQTGLRDAEAAAAGPPTGANSMFGPQFMTKLMMNPETRGFLDQPDFLAIIRQCAADPSKLTAHIGDARFQKAMQVGLGISFGGAGVGGDDPAGPGGMGGAPREEPTRQAPPPRQPEPAPEPARELTEEEKAEEEAKAAALQEKEAGAAAYKARDFDKALGHFSKAVELYDKDVSFLTNRAAVYMEQGNLDAAMADCTTAVEKARQNVPVDFKIISKAMTRHGNALVKAGRLQEAISMYEKALTEHRNPDSLKALQTTQKRLKDEQEAAYIDLGKAEEEKEAGNVAFKAADYPTAISHYSEALKRGPPEQWPEAYKVFSNRAACYTKLGALPEGEKDADKCIELNPEFVKGYSRKANVKFLMKEYEKALETYEQGLTYAPDSTELKDGIRRCQQQIQRFMTGMASEDEIKERQAKAMADPEIQNIMIDPVMQQVLKECQETQGSLSKHLQNPGIAHKLKKLMAAGIIRMS
eukprot:jgi/Ulvmu1/10868/UM007_0042.1